MRPSRTAALFFVLGAGLVPWTLLLADKLLTVLVEIPLAVLCFILARPEPTG